ncbi:aminotransferase class IV [Rhodococcus pyridinivorans]|uniref:Aminotransferase class IV n=1 Tax=Rhodococcus pyridinivorans TaxID=103816 RepID=A0A7M2XWE2_9NOCA|nr:aminotransferase class IV [Rhodococcus pyridinivorans]QOW02045.1 aminotransferase class IV [Rhodococcus pyridinivorans]
MSLEKPTKIWWNGRVTSWHEATVHVTAETAVRGVNAFEGVMAYKIEGHRKHAVIALDKHLERLSRSAELLHLPMPYSLEEIRRGVLDLVCAEPSDLDLYIRPTVYLESGAYTDDPSRMRMGAYITSYTRERAPQRSVRLVSTPWTRVDDPAFPAQAKSGAVYSAFRLARIAATKADGDEPLLLNARGTVAETAGSAVMAVFSDHVVSPPPSDGALESITRDVLTRLLEDEFGLKVVQRSLHVQELYEADEIFLCGTLDEVVKVASFDGVVPKRANGGLAHRLFARYRALCTALDPSSSPLQTCVAW